MVDPELTPQEQARHDYMDSLYVVNKVAADYFQSCLQDPINQAVMDYALSRWGKDTIETFQIGFAEDSWVGFMNFAMGKGH